MAHKRRLLARLQSRADVLQSEWLSQSTFSKPLANKQGAQVGNKHIAWPVLAILNSAKLKMTTKRKRTCISGSRVQRKRKRKKKKKKKSHIRTSFTENLSLLNRTPGLKGFTSFVVHTLNHNVVVFYRVSHPLDKMRLR